ncbi:uncharacterized protein SOCEGT47_060360 [Sorangium cellulosum]|uniref:Uncharacterized protein n=1 Tax=Sorangium cellulosum TaxID=56 RepID=A0A4P2Q7Q9_SORCE|nr:uncharacterized protein SOCEGT47_060360 [Sorangium cellulosum]
MRVFAAEQVEVVRKTLREKTRLGPKPELVGLEEIARRARCSMQRIRRRLGPKLPAGRKLSQGPRAWWGFTPKEAKLIVAWVKRHVRRKRRAQGGTSRSEDPGPEVLRPVAFAQSPEGLTTHRAPGQCAERVEGPRLAQRARGANEPAVLTRRTVRARETTRRTHHFGAVIWYEQATIACAATTLIDR